MARRFAQHLGMENDSGKLATPKSLVRWAITPPQSYVVYFIALVQVAGLSFYAGSLKPKTAVGGPSVSAPRN
jgi:hypothetical protein